MLNLSLTQRFSEAVVQRCSFFTEHLRWLLLDFQKSFPQHGFEKSLCDHFITIIFWQLENLETLTQIIIKGYHNNAINVR